MPKTGRKGRGFYPRPDPATSRKALRLAKFGPDTWEGDAGDKSNTAAKKPNPTTGGQRPAQRPDGKRPLARRARMSGPAAGNDRREPREQVARSAPLGYGQGVKMSPRSPQPTNGSDADGRVIQRRGRPRHGGYTPQFDRRKDRPGPTSRIPAKGPKKPSASLLPGEIRENRSHPSVEGREVYGGRARTRADSKGRRPLPREAGSPTTKAPQKRSNPKR